MITHFYGASSKYTEESIDGLKAFVGKDQVGAKNLVVPSQRQRYTLLNLPGIGIYSSRVFSAVLRKLRKAGKVNSVHRRREDWQDRLI